MVSWEKLLEVMELYNADFHTIK